MAVGADLTSRIYGGGVNVVTQKKLFGGFYGFQVVFPVGANNRIQGTEIDANPGGGLSDSVFAPIILGWHFKRADATAGYTIFAPTGRYTDGASDNTGLGMWGHELSVGTTVYLTESRQWHAATLATFDFQSKKEDSETKVGNVMNLEGGLGADFLKGGLTTGLNYYASFKLTDDQIDGLPGILIRGKNKVFAFGPEVQLALATKNTLYGFAEGELPVGGLRPHGAAGECADDPRHLSHEAAQASQSLRPQMRGIWRRLFSLSVRTRRIGGRPRPRLASRAMRSEPARGPGCLCPVRSQH